MGRRKGSKNKKIADKKTKLIGLPLTLVENNLETLLIALTQQLTNNKIGLAVGTFFANAMNEALKLKYPNDTFTILLNYPVSMGIHNAPYADIVVKHGNDIISAYGYRDWETG